MPTILNGAIMTRSLAAASLLALLVAGQAPRLTAQGGVTVELMGQGIVQLDRVDPVPGGGRLTETRVVQPIAMLRVAGLGGHLSLAGTLDLEGATIPDGVLLPGGWGEGFNDRRHPHTYAHELMLSGNDVLGRFDGGLRISLSAGKGFVPFGSDDPMSRPVNRYPVNHHLAQILERAVGIAGVRAGPVVLEASLFNGDEPERPGQWPLLRRSGDSWAARLTLLPVTGIELSASRAKVHSPEHRPGSGTDAWKWHASARVRRLIAGGEVYALGEWARTEEAEGFFHFSSLLAETAYRRGAHQAYYRFERTERPEDLRETDLFRSVRPHLENSILGVTRFTLHTLGYRFGPSALDGRLVVEPFIEGTAGRAENVGGGVLTPAILYGTSRVRSFTIGLRLAWRMTGHRMGRYGGLLDSEASPHHRMHM